VGCCWDERPETWAGGKWAQRLPSVEIEENEKKAEGVGRIHG
jgi:hypothetical protein